MTERVWGNVGVQYFGLLQNLDSFLRLAVWNKLLLSGDARADGGQVPERSLLNGRWRFREGLSGGRCRFLG